MREPTEDDRSVLAVIVDCSPSWEEPEALGAVLEQMLVFLNAYQLLSATNQLTVLASNATAVEVLWPPPEAAADVVVAMSDPHGLRAAVARGVAQLASSSDAGASSS